MRKKKNLPQRIESCGRFWIDNPGEHKGKWNGIFGNDNAVHLEIGCGKGGFITALAAANTDISYVAVEKNDNCIVMAMEKAGALNISNVKFMRCDARLLSEIFAEGEIERIYLNFSDPWPKGKHEKRRLTHDDFLKCYRGILKKDGDLQLKTDNQDFFEFSMERLLENQFIIDQREYDLHNSHIFDPNTQTEYEQMFSEIGHSICFLRAVKNIH